jgi:hypothetical protein
MCQSAKHQQRNITMTPMSAPSWNPECLLRPAGVGRRGVWAVQAHEQPGGRGGTKAGKQIDNSKENGMGFHS